jgi:hypothetical protein
MSLPLTDSAYQVSLTMGPDVRNRVKPGKNENQCTLERISSKLGFFAISRNIGGFAYFPLKCGGFLGFSHYPQFTTLLSQTYPPSKLYFK